MNIQKDVVSVKMENADAALIIHGEVFITVEDILEEMFQKTEGPLPN
jgi:hypothetical protein